MGNITIQGDLTGDVPGGEVGGASNLTTVGAIPYVSAAGTLNQDPTALFWDAANNRLGVGTNAPSESIQSGAIRVLGQKTLGTGNTGLYLFADTTPPYSATIASLTPGSSGNPLWIAANPLSFGNSFSGAEAARFAVTTNNLLIGTTTDSNFKLDVATSGSAGTARFYGGAGVSNSTKVVVQAGGGQGTSALVSIQDGAASEVARLTDNVNSPFRTYSTGTLKAWFGQNFFMSNSAGAVGWTPTGDASASPDLSLSRASAGVLQVGDGGANANGYLSAARLGVGTNTPASNTVLNGSGNPLSIGSVISTYVGLARGNVAIDTSNYFIASDGSGVLINAPSTDIGFNTANTNRATIKATTGNLLLGTTTDDGSSKLQVSGNVKVTAGSNNLTVSGSSGQTPGILFNQSAVGNFYIRSQASTANLEIINDSLVRLASLSQAGTFSVYNETAPTGVTKAVIRAGAGQSTTNLTEWQNASTGAVLARVDSNGSLLAPSGSASVPGLSFTAATNAGLYWDGTYLNFSVGGSRVGYIRSADIGLPSVAVFGSTQVSGAVDGNLLVRNNAGTGFTSLQLGGTTSSFPALKRSSAILQARLADDSANTQMQASRFISDQTTPSASTDSGTAGAIWADANYIYVQTAAGTIKRVALTTF